MQLSTAVPYAQGATGRVLKAIDEASGRVVAIKVLRLDDPLWRARWQREAAALQRLDHPHVCALLTATEYEGQPALIFPFIDGASIDVALADASWRTTLTTMIDVIDAVAHAHALGVVHRDLKPANILVQQLDGRAHAWVVDFGLAAVSAAESLTLEGQVLGTPGYLSPEQAQGRAATERSDIYSLGALLFRLLAGRLPHAAERSTELLLRTIRDDAPLLSRFRPDLPPALGRIVQHCLERNPARRYASAARLRDDLTAALADRPVAAPAVGSAYLLKRRIRRAPWLTAAVAVAVLALILAGWSGWRSVAEQRLVAERSRQLEQQVAGIERDLQLLYLAPTHDIRAGVAAITSRALAEAENLARVNTGPIAAGAQAAIGRLMMAIGRSEAALEPLERAWYAGLKDSQMAQLLGQAHAAAYLEALEAARRQVDEVAYREALAAAEAAHGEPARAFLAARPADDAIAQGLLARLRGDTEAAIAALDAAPVGTWEIPTRLLALQLRLDQASERIRRGDNRQAAQELESAAMLVHALTDSARSHPEVWRLACRHAGLVVELGQSMALDGEATLAACQSLRQIDPGRQAHRIVAARAYRHYASYRYRKGQDPRPAISQGLRWIDDGATEPDAELAGLKGALLYARAIHQQQVEGRLAIKLLEQAVAQLELALADRVDDPEWLAELARAMQQLGSAHFSLGESGDEVFERAIGRLQNSAAQRYPSLQLALIDLLAWRGYERSIRGQAATEILDQALRVADRALQTWPDDPALLAAKGMAARTLAEHQLISGSDPSTAAQLADAAYRSALAIQPDNFSARFNRCGIPIAVARWRLTQALSIDALLDEIDQQLDGLVGLSENHDELAVQFAYRHVLAARQAIASGEHAAAHIAAARERLQVALSSDWDRIPALLGLAELALSEHRAARSNGSLDSDGLRADLATLDAGLRQTPQLAQLRGYRQQLSQLLPAQATTSIDIGQGKGAIDLQEGE